MGMHVHELHAAVVHAPLVLLPTAATVDLAAALTGDRATARLGRTLWWATVGSGVFAGMAGMAASQQVKAERAEVSDALWIHGAGNVVLVTGALAVALWRVRRRPTVAQALVGFCASAASLYTAYLGGELVYAHGVGVRSMPAGAPAGVRRSPPLLSWAAPGTLLRDAARGLAWLLQRGRRAAATRPLARRALTGGEGQHPHAG